ncbi:hypothetical protein AMAG_01342 [Allomyces macrogynus ATCC 38327]|uniref:Gelsolin-like domain-containing protein n=1 Tax=Allomyces macrogynus (strain ATCC 38327) TaxID=578462 RepID=A0A0L0RZ77_ALLM3|nr:hypothetical protein AMAG_01342 [Allomyces macrogynus ATCC 38327]|eukprot:KNE55450.1 hypothetical protein AMAG_01342 [Allomyces macrogynus ATCC 38327]
MAMPQVPVSSRSSDTTSTGAVPNEWGGGSDAANRAVIGRGLAPLLDLPVPVVHDHDSNIDFAACSPLPPSRAEPDPDSALYVSPARGSTPSHTARSRSPSAASALFPPLPASRNSSSVLVPKLDDPLTVHAASRDGATWTSPVPPSSPQLRPHNETTDPANLLDLLTPLPPSRIASECVQDGSGAWMPLPPSRLESEIVTTPVELGTPLSPSRIELTVGAPETRMPLPPSLLRSTVAEGAHELRTPLPQSRAVSTAVQDPAAHRLWAALPPSRITTRLFGDEESSATEDPVDKVAEDDNWALMSSRPLPPSRSVLVDPLVIDPSRTDSNDRETSADSPGVVYRTSWTDIPATYWSDWFVPVKSDDTPTEPTSMLIASTRSALGITPTSPSDPLPRLVNNSTLRPRSETALGPRDRSALHTLFDHVDTTVLFDPALRDTQQTVVFVLDGLGVARVPTDVPLELNDHDCYLVLAPVAAAPDDAPHLGTVYQWLGAQATATKVAASAFLTQLLRRHMGAEISHIQREESGSESNEFVASVPSWTTVADRDAARADPLHPIVPVSDPVRVYQWTPRDPWRRLRRVPPCACVMRNEPRGVFLVDQGCVITVVRGPKCPEMVAAPCRLVAEAIAKFHRGGKTRLETNDDWESPWARMDELLDGDLCEGFTSNNEPACRFGSTSPAFDEAWSPDFTIHRIGPSAKDLALTDSKAETGCQHEPCGPTLVYDSTTSSGQRPSWTLLDQRHCYVLDAGQDVYLWFGRRSALADRDATLDLLRDALTTSARPRSLRWIGIHKCFGGCEPFLFKLFFTDWIWELELVARAPACIAAAPRSGPLLDAAETRLFYQPPPPTLRPDQAAIILHLAQSALVQSSVFEFSPILGKCVKVADHVLDPIAALRADRAYVFLALYRAIDPSNPARPAAAASARRPRTVVVYFWSGPATPRTAFPKFSYAAWPAFRDVLRTFQCPIRLVRIEASREPLQVLAHLDRAVLVEDPALDEGRTGAKLFCVRVRYGATCVAAQVAFDPARVVARDAALVDFGRGREVVLWVGRGVTVKDRVLVEHIAQRYLERFDDDQRTPFRVVDDGTSEGDAMLAGMLAVSEGPRTDVPVLGTGSSAPCVFRVTSGTAGHRPRVVRVDEFDGASAHCTDHPDECLLVDPGSDTPLYVWVGKQATPTARQVAREAARSILTRAGDPRSAAAHTGVLGAALDGVGDIPRTDWWWEGLDLEQLARDGVVVPGVQAAADASKVVIVEHDGRESVQFRSFFFAWHDARRVVDEAKKCVEEGGDSDWPA